MTTRFAAAPLALSVAASLLAAACGNTLPDQDRRIVDAVPVERLSAALLWQDFATVPDQAARTYNGKAIIVTGEAARIGTDAPGDRYVYFARAGDAGGVHASLLDDTASGVLEAARANPRVTLKCFCEGLATDVVLKSCVAAGTTSP